MWLGKKATEDVSAMWIRTLQTVLVPIALVCTGEVQWSFHSSSQASGWGEKSEARLY
jgi:hypothetical protein